MAVPLNAAQAGTYARITFTSPLNTYDAALYAISNLGLQLVDPCYDQASLHDRSPAWHPMGQERTFARTHTLIVATNKLVTSNLWQQQLHALHGVISIEVPYSRKC